MERTMKHSNAALLREAPISRPWTCRSFRVCASAARKEQMEVPQVDRRQIMSILSAAALSTSLAGLAHAGPVVDALKNADPSLPAVNPPKVGDAIEAEAKGAGGAPQAPPPADVGKALSEGIKRVEVPDPLKTVLPDTSAGFKIQDKVAGIGERLKSALQLGTGEQAADVRDTIVGKALTPNSPKVNFEK